jgi:hypothetical protein
VLRWPVTPFPAHPPRRIWRVPHMGTFMKGPCAGAKQQLQHRHRQWVAYYALDEKRLWYRWTRLHALSADGELAYIANHLPVRSQQHVHCVALGPAGQHRHASGSSRRCAMPAFILCLRTYAPPPGRRPAWAATIGSRCTGSYIPPPPPLSALTVVGCRPRSYLTAILYLHPHYTKTKIWRKCTCALVAVMHAHIRHTY